MLAFMSFFKSSMLLDKYGVWPQIKSPFFKNINQNIFSQTATASKAGFTPKTGCTKSNKFGKNLAPKIVRLWKESRKFFSSKLAKEQIMITEQNLNKVPILTRPIPAPGYAAIIY